MAVIVGCGNAPLVNAVRGPLFVADCSELGDVEASDVVVLDWTGGVSSIYPDDELPPLDFSNFTTPEGSLADVEGAFKAAVRDRVAETLCGFPGLAVAVREGEGPSDSPLSTVYITFSRSPNSRSQIGEGQYDPCNEQHDNDAIIFGEDLMQLGGPYTYDEWVLIVSNVVAHETGHMLGFPHAARTDDNSGERALFVELMLATHTLDEMLSEQRFLSPDTNCPADAAAARQRVEPPSICEIRN